MKAFVFVVCGSREHVDTLNYSLRFIRHFSSYPIVVLTDPKRNEVPILHNNIIEVETPAHFDHHQASIYLKTGIHKFLNMEPGNMYCYLDSDIVAISTEINNIFNHFAEPIIFAPDHCLFDEFSPHAMNCGCLADTIRRNNQYKEVDAFFAQEFFKKPCNEEKKQELDALFATMNKPGVTNTLYRFIYAFKRYLLPFASFRFGSFVFRRNTRMWFTAQGEYVGFDFKYYARQLRRTTGLHFDAGTATWYNAAGENIMPRVAQCDHLRKYCLEKYDCSIPADWNHCNGGVFLFNHRSIDFLDYWHRLTLEEFADPRTKTRDQATLAVSMWKFGLQHTARLKKEFNFITEYDNTNTAWHPDKGFTYDGFNTVFTPYFLHIYHEWGHKGWSIWDYVEELEGASLRY